MRRITTSLAEAVAVVLGAVFCFILISYVVEKDSVGLAPGIIMVLYPLPIGLAALRKHHAVLDITIINLWLGWTVIGWTYALLWACDTDVA